MKLIPLRKHGLANSSQTDLFTATLTGGTSGTSSLPMSRDMISFTLSQGLQAGPKPYASQGYRDCVACGQALARADLSPWQANALGLLTSGTYGQRGSTSSNDVDLCSSLGSRLRRAMASHGSTLFNLTFQGLDTPAGQRIFQLRASARPISGKGCGSWPTPMAGTPAQNGNNAAGNSDSSRRVVELMASWPTPNTPSGGRSMSVEKMDATGKTVDGKKHTASLEHAVKFVASWGTPTTRDWKDGDCQNADVPINGLLARQTTMLVDRKGWTTPTAGNACGSNMARDGGASLNTDASFIGPISNGSSAETENIGQLNPAFSLWLQGYGTAWARCAVQATPSARKRVQSSLKTHTKKSSRNSEPSN